MPRERELLVECKYVVRYPSEGIYNIIYHIYPGETFDWETGELFVDNYAPLIPPPNTIYYHKYFSMYWDAEAEAFLTYRSHGSGTGGAAGFQFYDEGSEPSYDNGCVPSPPEKKELGNPPDKECNSPSLFLTQLISSMATTTTLAPILTLAPSI